MTRDATAVPAESDADRQAAELAAMRRMLHASHGCFSLSVAICNSPALRNYLIEQIRQTFPGIAVLDVPVPMVDVYGYVLQQPIDAGADAIFLIGLEKSIRLAEPPEPAPSRDPTPETHHMIRSFNASRDLWQDRYNCPLVVWLPEYAVPLMVQHAPDLWRFVSHRFEFVSPQATAITGMADRFSGELSLAANLTEQEKHFRIAELEQRVADASDEPPTALLPHVSVWLHELGFLHQFLGDLNRAEEMLQKALAINEKFDNQEDIACDIANLGLVYAERGELDRAEAMHKKALDIEEKLGRQEGMARQFGNLGMIYRARRDLDLAEQMHKKALGINEKLGRQQSTARQNGNLGVIYAMRGELDRAEEMIKKALVIQEKLGLQQDIAIAYHNLGSIAERRGDLGKARELWTKALHLYAKIGMKHMVERVQGWLDGLEVESSPQ